MRKLIFYSAFLAVVTCITACKKSNDNINCGCDQASVPGVAVDLGLSVKWADRNVGADSIHHAGCYFAWGETTIKYIYAWGTYKFGAKINELTKYCNNSEYGKNGFTDEKIILDLSDDAANVNWGGKWRMPTDAEWTELRTKCTWTWTTKNGVKGYEVKATNGNSIFLPAAGSYGPVGRQVNFYNEYGRYWSSSLNSEIPYEAQNVGFYRKSVYDEEDCTYQRYRGESIRPVVNK